MAHPLIHVAARGRALAVALAVALATLAGAAGAEPAPPLPQLYRATLPCLVHVFQVPHPTDSPDAFKAFFNLQRPTRPPADSAEPREIRETRRPLPNGLGLIWGDGTLALTAEFLVPAERRDFVLETADGRRVEAKVQALDRLSGVALLKATTPLGPACAFGRSAGLEIGQPVVAIGNVRGLRLLMSSGLLAGYGAAELGDPPDPDTALLSTTHSGPGMAGGPLLDLQGRVIGMHRAMLVGAQGYEGVAVAVPVDTMLAAAADLARFGRVQRAQLGVVVDDERPLQGKAALLDPRRVPVVSRVLTGGPAERAGVKVGDRLLATDVRPLQDTADLRRRIAAKRPGTPLQLEVEHDSQRRTVALTLDLADAD